MKTKCMRCGGPTKKMQKGGSTDSTRTAPYVSPKGAFYPDKKSLESGCAKNPNSPECKKVIKTMSPAEAAKIKGRLQKGGAIKKMQNGGTADLSQDQIDRNKIKQTGSTWRGGTRSKEVTRDQNLYDPNKNSGAVTKTKRNAAGEIIKQKTRIVSNAKAQKKYNKIFNSTNRQTKTCFSGSCK